MRRLMTLLSRGAPCVVLAVGVIGCGSKREMSREAATQTRVAGTGAGYEFVGGFPTSDTVQEAYDDADLARATEAYKFFYPTVSIFGAWQGNIEAGVVPNQVMLILHGRPEQIVFTPGSETPSASGNIDLTRGPIVVEVPPGPLMGVVDDLNQRCVMDLGVNGPDAGKGGTHIILPPGYRGKVPRGYHSGVASTNRVLLFLRTIPSGDGEAKAIDVLRRVQVRPLDPPAGWTGIQWIDQGNRPQDFTPVRWERGIEYWGVLHSIIDQEPAFETYRMNYGQLAALGIEKGKPFAPDERMKSILEKAAKMANDQMRVQAFADRDPDRIMWADRQWEWARLRPENGTLDTSTYHDLEARAKWFYQAQIESPAMFRRTATAGSLCWLCARDSTGAFLDGSKRYRLRVPRPVPARLSWSVTVYDPETRGEIATGQERAALRSMFGLRGKSGDSVELHFGPEAPPGHEGEWIQTLPGKGWFAYFRIYGPEPAALDGSWKPGDFEEVK